MDFLVITESLPFPPRNGKELPTSKIIEALSSIGKVDLLIVSNNKKDYENRVKNLPPDIYILNRISSQKTSKITSLINEVFYSKPIFINNKYDISTLRLKRSSYELVWISPIGLFSCFQELIDSKMITYNLVGIGLNDVVYNNYRDAFNEMLGFRMINTFFLFRFLRSFFIKKGERKILSSVDLIHVQTMKEQENLCTLSPLLKAKSIVLPNGIKKDLLSCTYQGRNSNKLLFMTHLDKSRSHEAMWFLKKIWPLIKLRLPFLELIIVGSLPVNNKEYDFLALDKNIKLHGYVNDLKIIYDNVFLSVVPIFHGTGLINRVLDSFTAGVPVVTTSNVISTFNLENKEQYATIANTKTEFEEKIYNLYHDKNYRLSLSKKGREIAIKHRTWCDNKKKLCSTIDRLLNEAI